MVDYDLQREIRRTIKQHLRAGGVNEKAPEALATGIVDLAKRRTTL